MSRLFPSIDNGTFIYDEEGEYSITHPQDAKNITHNIHEIVKTKNIHIADMTGGVGGNTISFMLTFKKTTGFELDYNRFNMLKNNVSQYDHENDLILINDDSLKYINNNYDVYFFDPPWGGPKYKKETTIKLYMSGIELKEIIKKIDTNKLVVIKIPFNYNYDYLNKYTIIKVTNKKNVTIVYFKT